MVPFSDTDVAAAADDLPRHDDFSLARRILEAACIATAVILLVVQWVRFLAGPAGISWWSLPFVVAGIAAADFVSGMIHWAADTWGSETMPLVGRRILRPFRVHHANPGDFLRRRFLDTNGDVAAIVILFLAGMFWIPAGSLGESASALLLGFCTVGLFTNQIHQWAHMPEPPRPVRLMQSFRMILSSACHERHHRPPHVTDYCIATGWCNGLLNRLAFFRRLERFVTWMTGIAPREDEIRFWSVENMGQIVVGGVSDADSAWALNPPLASEMPPTDVLNRAHRFHLATSRTHGPPHCGNITCD